MIDVLLVLGMHRSGTSAVAGTLSKLGGGLPKHLMPANTSNERGFFESVALMNFHDELLASAGTDWSDWRPFDQGWMLSPDADSFRRRAKSLFADEFDGSALPILKDPRICRFTPFWLDVLRDVGATPRIAMPIRSPLDVAQSLKQAQKIPLTHGLLMWLRHVLDAEAQTRSLARSIFTWSDFQQDWRGVCGRIATETHLSWPRLLDGSLCEIDRFLSKDLVHHDTDHATLVAHADVHEWTLRAYEALLELAANPFAASALATLDEIRTLLDQSGKLFGRFLIDSEIDLQEIRVRERTASSERDELRARQAVILAETSTVSTALSAAETARHEIARAKDDVSQRLAAAIAERDEIGAARGRLEAELDTRQQKLAAAIAERDEIWAARGRLEAELDTRQKKLAAAIAERDEIGVARGRLEAKLATRRQELAAAIAERDELGEVRANVEAELRSRQWELAEQATALSELAGRAEAAETERDEIAREKDELSRTLAAAVAERAELGVAHADVVAELQAHQRELVLKATALADLATVALATEKARHATEREMNELSQRLAAVIVERDQLGAAHAVTLAELAARAEAAEMALEEIAGEKDELSRTLAAAVAERADFGVAHAGVVAETQALHREAVENAAVLAAVGSRLRSADIACEQAALENAALAEARRADAAELHALSGQLVDAEAALSVARAQVVRKRFAARLIPNALKRAHAAKQLVRSGLFEAGFYRTQGPASMFAALPGGRKGDLALAKHYLEDGYCRAFRPNPLFDTRWYLTQYGDVRRAGINPLLHYLESGTREGRDPGPGFHTEFYLEANPDVRASGVNPLTHYLRYGRQEGRPAMRPETLV